MKTLSHIILVGMLVAASPAFASAGSDGVPQSAWTHSANTGTGEVLSGQAQIDEAMLRIVPSPYRVRLDSSIPRTTIVRWPAGSDWFSVLESALRPLGLDAKMSLSDNTVLVGRAAKHVPVVVDMPPAVTASATPPVPAKVNDLPPSRIVVHVDSPAKSEKAVSTPVPAKAKPVATATPAVAAEPAKGRPVVTAVKPSAPVTPMKLPQQRIDFIPMTPPKPVSPAERARQVGKAFVMPAGMYLSQALSDYAKTFGWDMRWLVPENYKLDAPFPIPASNLRDGLDYVFAAYKSQGGLLHSTYVLNEPNFIVSVRPTTATNSSASTTAVSSENTQ